MADACARTTSDDFDDYFNASRFLDSGDDLQTLSSLGKKARHDHRTSDGDRADLSRDEDRDDGYHDLDRLVRAESTAARRRREAKTNTPATPGKTHRGTKSTRSQTNTKVVSIKVRQKKGQTFKDVFKLLRAKLREALNKASVKKKIPKRLKDIP